MSFRRYWQHSRTWFFTIHTSDPVRLPLNTATAGVIAVVCSLGSIDILLYPEDVRSIGCGVLGWGIAWWFNRRGGTFGAMLTAIVLGAMTTLVVPPADYVAGRNVVPAEFALSLFLAGLLAGPRYTWLMLPIQIALAVWQVTRVESTWMLLQNYVVVLCFVLLVVAAAVSSIAAVLVANLRRVAATNDNLEAIVRERTTQLRQVMDARTTEINAVIHDLGNSTAMLQTALSTALVIASEHGLPDMVAANAWQSMSVAQRMHERLVDDLRDAVRLEAHTLTLQPRATDLGQLAHAIRDEIWLQYTQHTVPPRIDIHDLDHPVSAWCDTARISRVLFNLIGNALKFSIDACGGAVVTMQLVDDDAQVGVAIRDNGEGIAPEDLTRLGQPFVQVGGDTTGMGLGLTFCKRIVQQSDGTLTIASTGRGQGTTVTIRLPRAVDTPSPTYASSPHVILER